MEKRIVLLFLFTIGSFLNAQDQTINGTLTVNGNFTFLTGIERLHWGTQHVGATNHRNYLAPRKTDDTGWDYAQEFGYHHYNRAWYFESKVGMGTNTPIAGLQVERNSNIGGKWNPSGGIFMTSQGSHSLIMDTNEMYSTGTLYLGSKTGDIVRFRAVSNTGANDKVVIKSDGKMGVGTVSPQGNLHVSSGTSGDAIFRLEADTDNSNESDNPLIQIRQDGGQLGVNIGYSEENFGGNIFGIGTRYSGQESWDVFTINTSNGNVGIGTKNAGSWKLAVKGKIRAEEIKVETGWADYVFKEGYDLPTLEEVERHIQEKGHLINIPPAEEVAANGIELGEMNMKLLEKIEELTLYTIQMKKEQKKLEERIKTLEKESK